MTTDDMIGMLDRRIEILELKLETLCAMLDGRNEADSQWRNAIEDKLDRLGEPMTRTTWARGRIG